MSKQIAIVTSLLMAAGFAFTAQAMSMDESGATADVAFGQSFAALDSDGDGMISWAEAKANGISESAFHSAETTQDGMLSMAEYRVAVNAKDGVVGEAAEIGEDTGAEAEPMTYETMDANDDDRVSKAEFMANYMDDGVYDRWDANDDGMVDRQEFVDVVFVYYDTNNDGYIDTTEWEESDVDVFLDAYGEGNWST